MTKRKTNYQLNREYMDRLNAENISFIKEVITDYLHNDSKVKIIALVIDKHSLLLDEMIANTNTDKYDKLLTELADKVANDYDPKYL